MRLAAAFSGLTMILAAAGPQAAQAASPHRETASEARRSHDAPPQRRRPRVYIYRDLDERGVYPRYFPGEFAVRDCTARLVPEYRPSGTVIVPRTNCFWRQP
jgi:hypothetical protein